MPKSDNRKNDKKKNKQKQFLSFNLGSDIFGIDVINVQEIIGMVEIIHLPNTLPFMKGVIDLRDTIVPIVDLRIKFNINQTSNIKDNVILITEIKNMLIGLFVDSVSDVITMEIIDIQRTPHFSSEIETDAITGIAKYDNKIIVILLPDKIFKNEELDLLKEKISV